MPTTTLQKEYFKGIGQIQFEGPETDNPLAYRWYDEQRVVAGKPLKAWLRFACAYWHSFNGSGADPFGEATHLFPWNKKADPLERARDKADAAFEFISKLGLPYYCFHDVDVVDFTNDIIENEKRLQAMTSYLSEKQKRNRCKIVMGHSEFIYSQKVYERGCDQS